MDSSFEVTYSSKKVPCETLLGMNVNPYVLVPEYPWKNLAKTASLVRRQSKWGKGISQKNNKNTALKSKSVLGHQLKYLGLTWSQLRQKVGTEKGN